MEEATQPAQFVVTEQPPLTTNTVVVVTQQQPQFRNWSSGLCGCCEDCGSCCCGYFFPCCMVCHLSSRMGEGCCFGCCCPNALAGLRVKIRTQNNIQGSMCDDYCITCCCPQLVMCQISRELKSLGQ